MIRINQIKINPLQNEQIIEKKICRMLGIDLEEIISWEIFKKSIDARKKDNIFYIYSVNVEINNEDKVLKKIKNNDIQQISKKSYDFACDYKGKTKPIVVGAGPSGLFCALVLAQNGAKPLIIERGKKVEDRVKDIDIFWNDGILDTESNIQFGEGGAGTFSDGKLNTLIKDKDNKGRKVLSEMVKAGAPKEILYYNKPHVGTDKLRRVIINIRKEIERLGGEFKYSEKVVDIITENNKVKSVITNKDKYDTDIAVIAIGHSARDTFYMLNKHIEIIAKPFSIGLRIEHLQKDIDLIQYGRANDKCDLPAADYKLVHHCNNGRSVYTFCMCPGGEVIGASSEENCLVTNGMSYFARDMINANSAILVGITPDDFKSDNPLAGIELQREIENKAFIIGGSDYYAPVQLFKDFKSNNVSINFGNIKPSYKPGVKMANLRLCLPEYIVDSLIEGITAFGKKIKGFDEDDVVLTGVETRSSSPVRLVRDDTLESKIKGIFPIGEGAGYAGGIMSSSIDGIRVAELILTKS